MKSDIIESVIYFLLTTLLLLCVIVYHYRPFDPFPLSSRKETFLDPNETYIEDAEVRKNTQIPSGLQSNLPLTLSPYQEKAADPSDQKKGKALAYRVSESFIKSSFNSVWDGAKCSVAMMTYAISRGCRFLDFEVFVHLDATEDNQRLVVAYGGNMRDNKTNLKSADVLSLAEVLKFVMSNAFSSTVTPVATDPLFLHFRVQVAKADSQFTYQQLASLLKSSIPASKRIKTNELADSSIGTLRNKCAVLFDALTCPWLPEVSDQNFQQLVTAYTGTDAFPLLKFGPTIENGENNTSSDSSNNIQPNPQSRPQGIKMVGVAAIPSRDSLHFIDALFSPGSRTFSTSFTLRSLTSHPSITFMALPFYVNNNDLREYETFFNEQKTACASKTAAIAYVEELVGEVK